MLKKYKTIEEVPLRAKEIENNNRIKKQFKFMRETNLIVEVLEHWLKRYHIKTTDYDRKAYQKIAWDILEVLHK